MFDFSKGRGLLALVWLLGLAGCDLTAGPALTIDSEYQSPGEPAYTQNLRIWVGFDGKPRRVEWDFTRSNTEKTTRGEYRVLWEPNGVRWENEAKTVRGSATWTDRELNWTELAQGLAGTPSEQKVSGQLRFDSAVPDSFSDERWDYLWTSGSGFQQWPRGPRDPQPRNGFTTAGNRLVYWVDGLESERIVLTNRVRRVDGQYLSAPLDDWVPAGTVVVKGSLYQADPRVRLAIFVLLRQCFFLPVWARAVFEQPDSP